MGLLIVLAGLTLLAAACSSQERATADTETTTTATGAAADEPAYSAEQRAWEQQHGDSYRIAVVVACSCPARDTWTLTVEHGRVLEIMSVSRGTVDPVPDEIAGITVAALFDRARDYLANGAEEPVTFDGNGRPLYFTFFDAGPPQDVTHYFIRPLTQPPPDDFLQARERWAALHLDRYVLDVTSMCWDACPDKPGNRAHYRVEVKNATPVEITDEDGHPISPGQVFAPTAEEAFRWIEMVLSNPDGIADIRYDKTTGLPLSVNLTTDHFPPIGPWSAELLEPAELAQGG